MKIWIRGHPGQKEGRQDGRTDRFPLYSTGLCPLRGRCPAPPQLKSHTSQAGHLLPLGCYFTMQCHAQIHTPHLRVIFQFPSSSSLIWSSHYNPFSNIPSHHRFGHNSSDASSNHHRGQSYHWGQSYHQGQPQYLLSLLSTIYFLILLS